MKRIVISLIALAIASNAFAQENRAFRKGYSGNVEVANMTVFGKDMYGGMMQVATTHGYQTGTGAFIGFGAGVQYDMHVSDVSASAFLDGKYNFLDAKVSPYAFIRTGVRFCVGPTLGNFINVGGGVDFGCCSVRLGYERIATITNHTILGKENALSCSFAFVF